MLLAPPGAVFRPLEVHEARASAGLPVPDLPPGMASKATDVAHLACGMAMQSAGLAVSMRIDRLLAELVPRYFRHRKLESEFATFFLPPAPALPQPPQSSI